MSVHETLGLRGLTDHQFELLRALIERETGIHLGASKKALVESRLRGRLRALGLNGFGAYYRHLQKPGVRELEAMIDRISTGETSFFREPDQFSLLGREVLPGWRKEGAAGRRSREIRVWCAGCSTGEEAYSVAMLLADAFPAGSGWELSIMATDVSRAALEHAEAGIWPVRNEAEIPESYRKRFMRKGTGPQAGRFKAGPEISRLIRFQPLNLIGTEYPIEGPFDLIFCRNVLIYFAQATRQSVVRRLVGHLAPTGFLLLGHAEGLLGTICGVRSVIPAVYAVDPHASEWRRRVTRGGS